MLVIYHNDSANARSLDYVLRVLKESGVLATAIDRQRLTRKAFRDIDLAISVGGDGTFLRASHFNLSVPMVGYNTDKTSKEGVLTVSRRESLGDDLRKFLSGALKISEFPRIRCRINGRELKELALNDLYVGPEKSYRLFNYILNHKDVTERQRSSGIIIATPVGSHAWIKSAGGTVLSLGERRLEYMVREPYIGRLNPMPRAASGMLSPDQVLTISPLSPGGIVVFDSVGHEHKLHKGDSVEVAMSTQPLRFVVTDSFKL